MYYNPYSNNSNYYVRAMQMDAIVRVFHTVPNAPNVDVYANGNLIVQDLGYKEMSDYLPIPAGDYNIQVYPTGETQNPVINTNVYVPENTIHTVAAIGTLPNISLFPIPEAEAYSSSDRACLRFVHLSPNAPSVDIALPDGTVILNNVSYMDITNYVCVPAGTYAFNVNLTGTDNVALSLKNIRLDPDTFYTVYAVGLAGDTPQLEAVLVSEPR